MTTTIYWSIQLDPSLESGEFNVPDDATDEEIEEAAKEAAFEGIDWSYNRMKYED